MRLHGAPGPAFSPLSSIPDAVLLRQSGVAEMIFKVLFECPLVRFTRQQGVLCTSTQLLCRTTVSTTGEDFLGSNQLAPIASNRGFVTS